MSEWNAFEHSAENSPPEEKEETRWRSFTLIDSGDVHNVPVDGIMDHELNADCSCNPEVSEVCADNQLLYRVYGHIAKDGRAR